MKTKNKPQIIMNEPKVKQFRIIHKDSNRIFWNVLIKFDKCRKTTESDYYESVWDINVYNEYSPNRSIIDTTVISQYDTTPDIPAITLAISQAFQSVIIGLSRHIRVNRDEIGKFSFEN